LGGHEKLHYYSRSKAAHALIPLNIGLCVPCNTDYMQQLYVEMAPKNKIWDCEQVLCLNQKSLTGNVGHI